jgi:hypothetical protein
MSFKININMPEFITIKQCGTKSKPQEVFLCKCKDCSTRTDGTEFPNFTEMESHLKTLNMTFFNCPIYGCNHRLTAHSATVTSHIKTKHPKVMENLKLSEPGNSAYYCDECNIYNNVVHFHCLECKKSDKKIYFKSKEECTTHLKKVHTKWWLEHDCKNGKTCTGFKSGKCGFNHLKHDKNFILNEPTETDTKICRYEKPWDNIRCNREECSYDHCWGRVRFVIKMKNKTKTRPEKVTIISKPNTKKTLSSSNKKSTSIHSSVCGDENDESSVSGDENDESSVSGDESNESSVSGDESNESSVSGESSVSNSSSILSASSKVDALNTAFDESSVNSSSDILSASKFQALNITSDKDDGSGSDDSSGSDNSSSDANSDLASD